MTSNLTHKTNITENEWTTKLQSFSEQNILWGRFECFKSTWPLKFQGLLEADAKNKGWILHQSHYYFILSAWFKDVLSSAVYIQSIVWTRECVMNQEGCGWEKSWLVLNIIIFFNARTEVNYKNPFNTEKSM